MAQVVAVAGAAVAGVFAGKYLEKKENDKDAEPVYTAVLYEAHLEHADPEEPLWRVPYFGQVVRVGTAEALFAKRKREHESSREEKKEKRRRRESSRSRSESASGSSS